MDGEWENTVTFVIYIREYIVHVFTHRNRNIRHNLYVYVPISSMECLFLMK